MHYSRTHAVLDSQYSSYGDMKMHVDSLEVRLCSRSLPTSCVWGNYCKQLALRRTAAAPLSSASCHVVWCGVWGGGGGGEL